MRLIIFTDNQFCGFFYMRFLLQEEGGVDRVEM